ncbi:hypothetical protein [Nocardia sp. CA-135398]
MGRLDEIAAAAVYIASSAAAFDHRIVLDVDGGRTSIAASRAAAA